MAKIPTYDRLKAVLVHSKVQVTNNPLWQVISQLIDQIAKFSNDINDDFNNLRSVVEDATIGDTGVVAGTYGDATNVGQFTVQTDGRLTFAANVPISGGGSSDHYDCPLSDGDTIEADIIFAGGECIIVQVPNP